MLGHVRLHVAAALGQRAPGTSRHLMQELERALARARVGAERQAQIAVDDADSCEVGEMVPFATISYQ